MTQPTNAQLAQKIGKVEDAMVDGFKQVNKRIDPIHDFMNQQIGYSKGLADKRPVLGMSEEQANIFKWLVLIIAALVGVQVV